MDNTCTMTDKLSGPLACPLARGGRDKLATFSNMSTVFGDQWARIHSTISANMLPVRRVPDAMQVRLASAQDASLRVEASVHENPPNKISAPPTAASPGGPIEGSACSQLRTIVEEGAQGWAHRLGEYLLPRVALASKPVFESRS